MKFKTLSFMNFALTIMVILISPLTTNANNVSERPKISKHQETVSLSNSRKISIQLTSIYKAVNEQLDGYSTVEVKNGSHLLGSMKFNTPNVNFKIYNISGLPEPIILFVSINSISVSSGFYSIHPYTIIGDRIKPLQFNKDKWELDTYSSGFYIGKLSNNEGIGAAIWKFIWSNDESHIEPHRYSITLYRWNGESFILSKHFVTKDKFSDGEAALKAYGLNMKDLSLDFGNLSAVR